MLPHIRQCRPLTFRRDNCQHGTGLAKSAWVKQISVDHTRLMAEGLECDAEPRLTMHAAPNCGIITRVINFWKGPDILTVLPCSFILAFGIACSLSNRFCRIITRMIQEDPMPVLLRDRRKLMVDALHRLQQLDQLGVDILDIRFPADLDLNTAPTSADIDKHHGPLPFPEPFLPTCKKSRVGQVVTTAQAVHIRDLFQRFECKYLDPRYTLRDVVIPLSPDNRSEDVIREIYR